jgi:hypothetical protein
MAAGGERWVCSLELARHLLKRTERLHDLLVAQHGDPGSKDRRLAAERQRARRQGDCFLAEGAGLGQAARDERGLARADEAPNPVIARSIRRIEHTRLYAPRT